MDEPTTPFLQRQTPFTKTMEVYQKFSSKKSEKTHPDQQKKYSIQPLRKISGRRQMKKLNELEEEKKSPTNQRAVYPFRRNSENAYFDDSHNTSHLVPQPSHYENVRPKSKNFLHNCYCR
jgi:hypothetical protein